MIEPSVDKGRVGTATAKDRRPLEQRLKDQVDEMLSISTREREQETLRKRVFGEIEKYRSNARKAREAGDELPEDYDSKMSELSALGEKAKENKHRLIEENALKLISAIESLTVSGSFKNRFNSYERFILTHAASFLKEYPFSGIQEIALNVLSLSVRGEHLTEKEAVEKVLDAKKEEYRDLSSKYSDRYPNDYLHELFYAIENCPTLVYGESGVNNNLIRRVVALEFDAIRSFAYTKIPKEYTVNRAYIDRMLELCVLGGYPEWSGERFLNKIQAHVDEPYSDEEFRTKSSLLRTRAEIIAKQIPGLISSTIAVGVGGSLARPEFFGFNPHSSDIDLVVYNHGWPYETKKITDVVQQLIKEGNPICTGATMDDGMGNIALPWSLTTVKEIGEMGSVSSPDNPFFDRFAFLASFHNETLIYHISDPKVYEDRINAPLRTFYKTQLAPLQRKTKELFAQLDGV